MQMFPGLIVAQYIVELCSLSSCLIQDVFFYQKCYRSRIYACNNVNAPVSSLLICMQPHVLRIKFSMCACLLLLRLPVGF